MKRVWFCVLLCLGSSIGVEGREHEGWTCVHESQTVFLEPPAHFSPRFEVAGCHCAHANRVLFLLRNSHKPQGNSWCVPGGKLKEGETPKEALLREVMEETGLILGEEQLQYCRPVFVRFPSVDFILHIFRYDFIDPPPPLSLALEENEDYCWVSYDEVLSLPLIPGGKECFCVAFGDRRTED